MREVKKKFFSILLTLCVVCGSCSVLKLYAAEANGYEYSKTSPIGGSVNISSGTLAVRAQPSTSSTILTSFSKGTNVMIVGESGDWWLIQYDYAGNTGYVYKEFISASTSKTYCWRVRSDITGSVNFRYGPGTEYGVITGLTAGTCFAHCAVTTTGWGNGIYVINDGYALAEYLYLSYFD